MMVFLLSTGGIHNKVADQFFNKTDLFFYFSILCRSEIVANIKDKITINPAWGIRGFLDLHHCNPG